MRQREAGLACLRPALDRARRALGKATPDEITKILVAFGDTFQVPIPDELLGYVAVLSKQPYLALRHGAMDLMGEHEYKRLPFPIEFVKAAQRYRYEIEFWHGELERIVTLLEKQP